MTGTGTARKKAENRIRTRTPMTGSIQDGKGVRYTYDSAETGKVIRFLFDRGELVEERREDAQKGNTYSDRSRRNIYYYVLHG